MKALVMRSPGNFSIENIPQPELHDDEVLVQMKAVALCGSDPPLLQGKNLNDGLPGAFPHIPGHEGAGIVVACGKHTTGFSVGDHVVVESHKGCGWCENCRSGKYNLCLNFGNLAAGHRQYGFTAPGCFAEYCSCHPAVLHLMPRELDFELGALTDTLATSLHVLDGLHPQSGESVLISGCGPLGLASAILAKSMGCRVIMLEHGVRQNFARLYGIENILDFSETGFEDRVLSLTGGKGADCCIDCAGTERSVMTSVHLCRKGGRIGLIRFPEEKTVPVDLKTLIWEEKMLCGFRGNPNCHNRVLSLMSSGVIDPRNMITHRFKLDKFSNAYELAVSGNKNVMKICIEI